MVYVVVVVVFFSNNTQQLKSSLIEGAYIFKTNMFDLSESVLIVLYQLQQNGTHTTQRVEISNSLHFKKNNPTFVQPHTTTTGQYI